MTRCPVVAEPPGLRAAASSPRGARRVSAVPAPEGRPAPRRRLSGAGPDAALALLAGLAVALVAVPLAALLLRTPWTRMPALVQGAAVGEALRLSLVVSLGSLAVAVALGLPLAWALARARVPGRAVVRALVAVPLVLPPVVGGVALLLALGPRSPLGAALEATTGVVLPFTTAGAVLAGAFVAMPFLVLTVEGALAGLSREREQVAATLGASRWQVLRHVTLPAVGPAVAAGAALAWARALGEFGATITFNGSVQGRTQTLPLAAYELLDTDPPAAYAASALLLVVSLGVLVALRSRFLPGAARRPGR